jgi:hypothetical protein
MNNDVIFTGPTHSLLLKTGPASTDHEMRKTTSASLTASPQADRKKKRYVKLDLSTFVPSNAADLFRTPRLGEDPGQEDQEAAPHEHLGSIGLPATQTESDHV